MWKLQERIPATLLVMRSFSILLGTSRGCVTFRDPTAFSRFNHTDVETYPEYYSIVKTFEQPHAPLLQECPALNAT